MRTRTGRGCTPGWAGPPDGGPRRLRRRQQLEHRAVQLRERGGGSSGAVVQGQLVNRRTASGESVVVVVLRTALGIGLAEAATDPIKNVTVTLTRQEDGATARRGRRTRRQLHLHQRATRDIHDLRRGDHAPLDPVDARSHRRRRGGCRQHHGTVTESAVNVGNVTVVAGATDTKIILQNDAQVAHLLNIAKAAGLVSADPVLQLRQSGWGWGRIAKHFGVHPSVIGLGHGGVSDADVEDFRVAHGKGKGNEGNGKGKKNGQA